MRFRIFLASCALLGAGCASPEQPVRDIRDRLLETARRERPDFFESQGIKVKSFSYVGAASTSDGPIYVVNVHAVLTGMLSPRGKNRVMFFDENFRFIDEYEMGWVIPAALRCQDGFVFLDGRTRQIHIRTGGRLHNGNVLDLSRGWSAQDFLDVHDYPVHSWNETVPTADERELERLDCDK